MNVLGWMWLIWGCGGADDPSGPSAPSSPDGGTHAMDRQADQEVVGHRPIPADNPVWDRLDGRFHRAPEFYGERSWDDVIMRVMGHYEHAARDLAGSSASSGDLAGAATRYRALALWLEGITIEKSTTALAMRDAYAQAARRDAALCEGLAGGGALVPPEGMGPVSGLRWRLLEAGRAGQDTLALASAAAGLLADPPWKHVDISVFRDFEARHALRLELVRYALDSVDPLSLDPVWGYWLPDEASRQVRILERAAREHRATPEGIRGIASREETHSQRAGFTVEGLGGLPTGDSYVDVGGEPGPMAIGVLERMDVSDPGHRKRLDVWVGELNAGLAKGSSGIPGLINTVVGEIDSAGHGSRYYNIKQSLNSGVRQLARAGAYEEALMVLTKNWPMHAQDFECPNRDGILQGIEGRLMLLAEKPGAEEKLTQAMATAQTWMDRIEQGRSPMPRQPPQ